MLLISGTRTVSTMVITATEGGSTQYVGRNALDAATLSLLALGGLAVLRRRRQMRPGLLMLSGRVPPPRAK